MTSVLFTLGRYAPVRVLGLQALEASSAAESTEVRVSPNPSPNDHATLTRARARTRAPTSTPTPAPALTLTLTLTLTPSLTPTLTPALTPNQGPEAGETTLVTTDGGVVRARSVVVCTNGWAAELLPELAEHLYPCRNQVVIP